MDELASNYDPEAQKEDGSCKYNTGESQIVFFWPADSTCGLFHMNIDGDTIVSEFDQASFHGTTPFVGQDLDSGTHTYDVGDDCDTWTGSFTIDPDSTLEITLVR